MLRSFPPSKSSIIYYDLENFSIARFPSKSNLKEKGSDNSIYFGMIDNIDISNIFCKLFKKKNVRDINGLEYTMHCALETVQVIININKEGQIQIKIKKDGTMYRLTQEYSFIHMVDYEFTNVLIVIDFKNLKIRFKDPKELLL